MRTTLIENYTRGENQRKVNERLLMIQLGGGG